MTARIGPDHSMATLHKQALSRAKGWKKLKLMITTGAFPEGTSVGCPATQELGNGASIGDFSTGPTTGQYSRFAPAKS
ncbi:MAG: hypothetical protein LBV30_07040 [Propionibacteriaceae bacterium]|jgi:hypothetical protein|nr:hypothetical protein [Propionibacteriaceae bacterium]